VSVPAIVRITIDGRPVRAVEGVSIAAAFAANGLAAFSTGRDGRPRGLHCGMGVCQECRVSVAGKGDLRACLTPVEAGMRIVRAPFAAMPRPVAEASAPPPVETCDVLIVGAGPAGLAAAEALAGSGLDVRIVDERPAPGGQFYKQRAAGLGPPADAQQAEGAALVARVRDAGHRMFRDTTVWGAFRDDGGGLEIGLLVSGRNHMLRPRALVVATGAYERAHAVPGWTLPGVMTTGAAQTLLRAYGTPPGRRVLVAGNGPLNFQLAAELVAEGVTVVALAELAPPAWTRPTAALAMAAADPAAVTKGIGFLAALRRAGVPVLYRHVLAGVTGGDRVESALLAPTDPAGRSGERRFAVDAVCLGYGFLPSDELPRLLGCETTPTGIRRDDDGATGVPGVYVVGEAGGFAGAGAALAQGRLAGLRLARDLAGLAGDDGGARRALRAARRFQSALRSSFSAPAPGLSLADDDTIVCRCEALTLRRLKDAVAHDLSDVAGLKRVTRAGMGRCQGRTCGPLLAEIVGAEAGAHFGAQAPLRPVPAAALAAEKAEWLGHRRMPLPSRRAKPAPPLPVSCCDVLIIGAGIAGLSTALHLARAGAEVVVVDRGAPGAEASGGNAGSLHVQLLSFDFASGPAAATLPLQAESVRLWEALEAELGGDFEIRRTGGVMVAETEADLARLDAKARIERAHGIDVEIVDAAALRQLEPALRPGLLGAAFCPDEGKINPLLATAGVLRAAKAAGARVFADAEVLAIAAEGGGFQVATARGRLSARRVVNAAGAWAAPVAALAGLAVPVHGAPLQMIVTEPAAPLVNGLVAHASRHLTLKQAAAGGLLIGGGWPAGARPTRASLEGNLWIAGHVVPALRGLDVVRSWAAMNIDIDGAPILGEHPGRPGFFHAVTSNGFTLGPIVGRLTADLVLGRDPGRDLLPFGVGRFDRA
jgi:glycine/D-amino acid oxidase-like deaminating enzyme/bacterioferritin-associated ferredoxin